MNRHVLILAPASDAHASAIAWALGRNGIAAIRAPSLRLSPKARLSVLADAGGVRGTDSRVDLTKFSAVWHRFPELPDVEDCAEPDREFAAKQWEYFQKNAFELADGFIDALWVNRPAAAEAADSKWLQLRTAHAVGLRFPEAVAGNDVGEVRRLLKRCGKLIFKQFYSYMWQSQSTGVVHSSGVVLLDESSDLPDEAIAVCPGIYQRYIDKAFDVRVTVIGERMFAVSLRRRDGEAYVDWRPHARDDDMLAEPFAIPDPVERKLRALMQRLGLVTGCIDLVADREGHLYFLEVNQQGQFLFVEHVLPQIPMLRAMTSMLLTGRADYSVDASADLRFADYLRSEDYQSLLAAPRSASPVFLVEA